jgi:hypothetical protein
MNRPVTERLKEPLVVVLMKLRTWTSLADLSRTRVRLPPPPPLNPLKTKGEILDAGTVPGVSTKKCVLWIDPHKHHLV